MVRVIGFFTEFLFFLLPVYFAVCVCVFFFLLKKCIKLHCSHVVTSNSKFPPWYCD